MTRTQLFMAITGAALCAVPVTATAHGGNNDPNVVHACIGNVSKVVRIVGAGDNCLSSPPLVAETPAHWSIRGPQGPQGVQGQQGLQGLPGTNGINGTNGIDGTSVTFAGYFTGNQNGCSNGGLIFAAGNPAVTAYVCNGTNGIDGENGTSGRRAAPPCVDNVNRYVDCGNGTVTDTVTGLIWLRMHGCLGGADWAVANAATSALADGQCGLSDGSSAGDWRLPTFNEWRATIARALALGCHVAALGGPSLTNDAGMACYSDGTSSSFFFVTGQHPYWSSTVPDDAPNAAWVTHLTSGFSFGSAKVHSALVWPVRSGMR